MTHPSRTPAIGALHPPTDHSLDGSGDVLAATTLPAALDAALADYGSRPAIVSPAGALTFQALDARTAAVAAALRTALSISGDPGEGTPVVAVALARSPELVAAILGTVRIGAAYLPLDPTAPDQYLLQVLTEATPALIITDTARAGVLRAHTSVPILTPADLGTPPGDAPAGARPPANGSTREPHDPAYVIYTSGSTGTPKGVVVPHAAIMNSTAARTDVYGPAIRVALLHSPAFDLFSGILWWSILTGGTLVIDPGDLRDVPATVALVRSHQITDLIYPASLYPSFLDHVGAATTSGPPSSLRAVGIGSEQWSPVLIERHADQLPGARLINEYGPTEACVCSSYATVYEPAAGPAALTIGPAVRNTGYLLLGPDGNPTLDDHGELAITGTNLASGYLGQPQLTAERFVVIAGQRAYRTGDLVERTSSGHYAFLGRIDRQVQVGGHRVEPGHIESVLMRHPRISHAHVGVHTTQLAGGGDPAGSGESADTLVAYLVAAPPGPDQDGTGEGPDSELSLALDCEHHLRQQLPAHLVPTGYIVLSSLPRTPAGKLDQRALAAITDHTLNRVPAGGSSGTGAGPAVPAPAASSVHARVVALTAQTLGLSTVAPGTSLRSLGASSLMIIRLAAGIARELGTEIPISALFRAQDLGEIADLVQASTTLGRPSLPGLARTSDLAAAESDDDVLGNEYALSGQQEQIWALSHLTALPSVDAAIEQSGGGAAPGDGVQPYNTQFSLLLHGRLDVGALEEALSHVVARHEILRTTFHHRPAGPVQVVHGPWPVRLDMLDLAELDERTREARVRAAVTGTINAGFDIERLPLVRWQLVRLAPQRWRLVQVEHHLVHDGWSVQLFLAEVWDAYAAIAAGRAPQLAPLPIQYRHYSTWYQHWRGSADHTAQIDYWSEHLAGATVPAVSFTPDRPRPPVQTYRGDRVDAHIPAETVAALDALAARVGVSRFAVWLSAFAVQIWQHTGARDLVVGSALVNRRLPNVDLLLGVFVNAVPLRVRIDPGAPLADAIAATMSVLLAAQDHQELAFTDLLPHLNTPRDRSRNPMYSAMFAFHDSPRPDLTTGGLVGEVVIEHNGSAKNDVNVVCVPDVPGPETDGRADGGGPTGLSILWEFNTDLFDSDSARELLQGFVGVLAAFTAEAAAQIPVRDLDLLGPVATSRILAAGAGSVAELPFAGLSDGFDATAALTPHAPALHHGDRTYSYLQVDQRARALQARLDATGIRPTDVVAVVSAPGIDLVVALLAILRLGAAYVCLDPGQPGTRLQMLLQDAGAAAVLTAGMATAMPAPTTAAGDPGATAAGPETFGPGDALAVAGTPVLNIDEAEAADKTHRPSPINSSGRPPLDPDSPAYLVYTSGSTGLPKAVVTSHRNAVTALHARTLHQQGAGTDPTTAGGSAPVRTLISLPIIFDVAASMLWWTFSHGGAVVFPDRPQLAGDPPHLADLIERHAVTHANTVASFYRHLLPALTAGSGTSLDVVAIGGEPCSADLVSEHAARLPSTALDVEYGPTEATVWASAARVHPPATASSSTSSSSASADLTGSERPHRLVPVGRPLANTVLAVLTDSGQLAPVNAVGELHIGGLGVAAGYHRRPDLTARLFITPMTGPLRGNHLYRSGDLARLRPDGQFELLGRRDDQVKIRGHRVELGEVTACLLAHPDVRDAAVELQTPSGSPGSFGTGRLIAYVATSHPDADLPGLLHAWVTSRLPAYMAPAGYTITTQLRRTATGKIAPQQDARTTGVAHASSSSSAEGLTAVVLTARQRLLLEIWRTHLQQPTLGLDDDFFTCGGDSLQAIRTAAAIRARGEHPTVADLLAAPSVRALDTLLATRAEEHPASSGAKRSTRRRAGTRLTLTAIQGWFFAQQFTDPDHFAQARLFELPPDCDEQTLLAAMHWTIQRHDAFRTRFVPPPGPGRAWVPVLDETAADDIVTCRVLPRPGELPQTDALATQHQRLTQALAAPAGELSITGGRLARATLLSDPDSHRRWLHLLVHHLLVDEVSWQILTGDIEKAYRNLNDGLPPPPGTAPGIPSHEAITDPPPATSASSAPPVNDAGPDPVNESEQPYWRALTEAAKPVLITADPPPGPLSPLRERIPIRRRLSWLASRYVHHVSPHRPEPAGPGDGAEPATAESTSSPVAGLPLLLAALTRALAPVTSNRGLYVWLEGHGRLHQAPPGPASAVANLEDVVGWLTSLYPVLLEQTEPTELSGHLVSEAARISRSLAAVPVGGTGFGRARYLQPDSPTAQLLEALDDPQVTVNYLGRSAAPGAGRLLIPSPMPEGLTIGPDNVLPTPVDLSIITTPAGTVESRFSIDPRTLTAATAQDLADRFTADLEAAARLVPLSPGPPAPGARTLYLVHGVDGGVEPFIRLARALGPTWDCYGLPYDPDSPDQNMEALAVSYLQRIRDSGQDGEFTVAGWSFGSVIAYEMARHAELLDLGECEAILLDPPDLGDPHARGIDVLAAHLGSLMPHQPSIVLHQALQATADLPWLARARALAARLGPADHHPAAVDPPSDDRSPQSSGPARLRHDDEYELTVLLQILLGAHHAMDRWQPSGKVAHLRVILASATTATHRTLAFWQQRSVDSLRVSTVRGTHRSMLSTAGLDQIATCLRSEPQPPSGGR